MKFYLIFSRTTNTLLLAYLWTLMQNFDPNASSTLGADLRSLRKSRKMTIKELSEATEKSLGWISQIERDKSQPSIDDLRDLAHVLNVPLSILFGQTSSG